MLVNWRWTLWNDAVASMGVVFFVESNIFCDQSSKGISATNFMPAKSVSPKLTPTSHQCSTLSGPLDSHHVYHAQALAGFYMLCTGRPIGGIGGEGREGGQAS